MKLKNLSRRALTLLLILASLSWAACSDAKELLDLALSPPGRKPLQRDLIGLNSFFVNSAKFGSIDHQYQDITQNLKLKHLRVLFAWTDAVQPSPNVAPNYSFYDNIVSRAPEGVELLVVLTHVPTWFTNSSTWADSNPRKAWVEQWLKPTIERYRNHPRIVGFEIFNEPDLIILPQDEVLGLQNADNYFELLLESYVASKRLAPGKLAIMTATTSIQQSFPTTLRYNQRLRDLGAEGYTDVWNVHYYSSSYETIVTSNGVGDFLNGLSKPIWVTESGKTGPNEQLSYVETAWPFLKEKIPGIQRFYYYQYAEDTPIAQNYGLRTADPQFPVSDMYLYLRDGTR